MTLLGERIRGQLTKLGISQAELARRVKVTQPAINDLVNGRSTSSKHLHRIARELETTVAYLTGETNDPQSEQPDGVLTSRDREDIALFQLLSGQDRDAIRHLMRSLSDKAPTPVPRNLAGQA